MSLDVVADAGSQQLALASQGWLNHKSTSSLKLKITGSLTSALSQTSSVPPQEWARPRRLLFSCAQSHGYEGGISGLVLFNLLLVVLETDSTTDGREAPEWMTVANEILMIIYLVEIILRIYVYRLPFFSSMWNVMDFVIVATDISFWCYFTAKQASTSLGMVKCLRLVRLLRLSQSLKLLVNFPDLVLAIKGLVGAFVAATWGMLLLLFIIMLFSIIAVQVLHPITQELVEEGALVDCERCSRAYESVAASSLTFLQAYVAGDSWGAVNIPILEKAPYTAPLFIAVAIVVDLMILNMILAFIVDSNADARQGAEHEIAVCLDRSRREATKRFTQICEEMDTDGNGELSMAEIISGFEEHVEFADILTTLGVVKEDMAAVFHMLDTDDSGQVDFQEFATQLYKMKSSDTQVLLCFIRMHVSNISKMVKALLQESNDNLREELLKALSTSKASRGGEISGTAILPQAELKAAEAILAGSQPLRARSEVCKTIKNATPARSDLQEEACSPTSERCQGRSAPAGAEAASPVQHELPPREVFGGDVPGGAYPELLASLDRIRAELFATMQDAAPTFKETTRLLKSLNERLPGVLASEALSAEPSWEGAYLKGSAWSQRPTDCARDSFQGDLPSQQRSRGAAGRGRGGGSSANGHRPGIGRPGRPELEEGHPLRANGQPSSVDPQPMLTHVYC